MSDIIDQIKGHPCCPTWDNGARVDSISDALAQVLSQRSDNEVPDVETTALPNYHKLNTTKIVGPSQIDLNALNGKCPECGTGNP